MWLFGVCLLSVLLQSGVFGLWDKEATCPRLCTCRLDHITETAIHRFMQQDNAKSKQPAPEAILLENNDVFYEDEFNEFDESSFVRSATCIVQTETSAEELINELPKEIQSVTLIQASDSGNKSIKFSYFSQFTELKIIELQSAQKLKKDSASHFLCEVDAALEQLQYLNLERVLLRKSNKRYEILENELNDEIVLFEYVQKTDGVHPLTFVKRGSNEKVLPYKTYIENQKNNQFPLFVGFDNLILLRIYECDLNMVHWEMFEGLNSLNNLILEKNNLRFIPDFAFYGTPNLKSLSLAWNDLLSIQITDLAGLLELEFLDLSHNNFSQLSELSLPPFPKLKLANFANNPITVVFPNTFEVMNTTAALILGGLEEPLTLLTNSFLGLKSLKTLTLLQLNMPLLKMEVFVGMPNLRELVMNGNIPEIQYDAFTEVPNLDSLIINKCNITKLSIDSFVGLTNLRILDLSKNNLSYLPPGVFDELSNIKEIYINDNKFNSLPKEIFSRIQPRMIRLNENPWHCSCDMSDWKPMLVNRIKQKSIKACDSRHDKGTGCTEENKVFYKYVYENRVAPKCVTPKRYENWNIFHVMRRQLKCPEFKPKLKKRTHKLNKTSKSEEVRSNISVSNESSESKIAIEEKPTIKSSTEIYSTENYSTEIYSTENIAKLKKLQKLNRKLLRDLKLNKTRNAFENNDISLNYPSINYSNNMNSFENVLVPENMIQHPKKMYVKNKKHKKSNKVKSL